MLRLNAIIHNLLSTKASDKVLVERCSSLCGLKAMKCDKCGKAGQFTMHSPYSRGLIYFSDGKRKDETIKVKRVICSCGRTHALLANNLIPYSSYSLRFIVTILWKYLHRTKNIQDFCADYYIAPKTIYKWVSLFLAHYKEWMDISEKLTTLTPSYIKYIESIENLPLRFFQKTKHSFLESKPHQHNCTIDSHSP